MRPRIGSPSGGRRLCPAAAGAGAGRCDCYLQGGTSSSRRWPSPIPSSAAFGEIGEGYAKASRFAEAHSDWFWLKGPEWDKHKFEIPIP